jgi:hypothetical protein
VFIHLVYFEGRTDPDRFVLPDRKLFEEFTAWLSDPKSAKGGWYYEHDEGSLTAISFHQIASMIVRPQPSSSIEPTPAPSSEHAIRRG